MTRGRRRITFVVDSPNWGGAEAVVAILLDGLARRWRMTLVAAAPVHPRLAAAGGAHGDVVVVDPVGGDERRRGDLHARVAATEPDVVHVNMIDPSSNAVLLAAAEGPWATVASVHMVGSVRTDVRATLTPSYRCLDAVIAVSADVASIVTGLGTPPSRVHLVHNGVVVPRLLGTRRDGSTLRIAGVGRLTRQKGWDVLVDAVARLRGSATDVAVSVAGDGRDRASLERSATGLPVTFVGHLVDVAPVLSDADLFCLPSREEGLPLALLEAMGAGLPCVATDVGEICAAVGDAVVVVPREDAAALAATIADLAADPWRRRSLGREAAAVVAGRFTATRMVADVHRILTSVASSRRCSPAPRHSLPEPPPSANGAHGRSWLW